MMMAQATGATMSQQQQPLITEMPELTQVYSMIKAMYEQNQQKDFASHWLEEMQRSVFAWQIADQLLLKRHNFESCYFAAQTLKTKIQYNYNELPLESYDSLKNSVISHLSSIDEKAIERQLCLSISTIFFMNVNWKNAIEELSTKLTNNKLAEVLICIAQEYMENRYVMKLSKERKEEIGKYLSSHVPNVIELLLKMLQECQTMPVPIQEQTGIQVFTCFEAWYPYTTEDHLAILEPMLRANFCYLKNPLTSELHEKATDAMCKVVYQCETQSAFCDLRVMVMNEILALESTYTAALLAEDTDKVLNLARLFTELGNSTIEFIVYDQVDTNLLRIILLCVGHYEYEVAEVTFTFWYNFTEVVFKGQYRQFTHIFHLLLTALTRHCQLESDSEGIINENSEQFDYRARIGDLVRDINHCIDWVDYIKARNMVQILKSANSWVDIEVNLYILYCIASETDCIIHNVNRNQVLPEIVEFILQLPNNQQGVLHIQVIATVCELLGQLSEWINENGNILNNVMHYLLSIITSSYQVTPKLATKACVALKQIVAKMKVIVDLSSIKNLFVSLENVYSQLDNSQMVELSVSLMACLTAVVSNPNFAKYEEQEFFVQRSIHLCLKRIEEIMNSKPGAEATSQKRWEKIIDNIYAIFKDFVPNERTLKSEAIHCLIQTQIWPFLRFSITHFCSLDSQAIEHCSRCVRHIVRSMKPSYLLQPIVDHIVPLYQEYPVNHPLLYIGSVLVSEFGNENDPTLSHGLVMMLNAFSLSTFALLNANNLNHHPYTIADYFSLCMRMLTKLTENFLANTETLNGILNLTILAIQVDQKEANDSVIHFIVDFIRTNHPIVDNYIKGDFGKKLFYTLIDAIMFKLPGYFIPDIVDAVWEFKATEPECFKHYLQFTVKELSSQLNKGAYSVTNKDLEEFYEALFNASSQKRIVSELRHLQRKFN